MLKQNVLEELVITMAADDMVPCIARSSVTMALNMLYNVKCVLVLPWGDFTHLCHLNDKKWKKMQIYFYVSWNQFNMARVNLDIFSFFANICKAPITL